MSGTLTLEQSFLLTWVEELCFFWLQLCVWEARFSPCSLPRPANISLVSFVHPLNERPRITPALCSDLERRGRADVLVGTAARLTTSAELRLCQPEQGAVAVLALFSFPLVCFLEI